MGRTSTCCNRRWSHCDRITAIKEVLEVKGIDYPGQASNVTLKRAPAVKSRGAENLSSN